MITIAIALLIGVQAPQQDASSQAKPRPAQILSKMFAHYADARSVVGTIKMTQSAMSTSVHTETNIQFNRPTLIFLHQVRDGAKPQEWYLTSDGKEFSYDRPDEQNHLIYGHRRNVESMVQHGTSMNLGDMLAAARLSLGDLNPMIETAIASKEGLTKLTGQWATLSYEGRVDLNGQPVYEIAGQYRDRASEPVSGKFEAYVNDNGDFVRFVLHQVMRIAQVSKDPFEVKTEWDASLKVDSQTEKSLYKVIR